MSKMSELNLEIQEIVDPMVYMGCSDQKITEEVIKYCPHIPESWIRAAINSARFDYNEPDSYY